MASRGGFDQDRTGKISEERGLRRAIVGQYMDALGPSNVHQMGERRRDRGIVAHDHCAIAAVDRSSPNRTICNFR